MGHHYSVNGSAKVSCYRRCSSTLLKDFSPNLQFSSVGIFGRVDGDPRTPRGLFLSDSTQIHQIWISVSGKVNTHRPASATVA